MTDSSKLSGSTLWLSLWAAVAVAMASCARDRADPARAAAVLRVDAAPARTAYPLLADPPTDTVSWEKVPIIPPYTDPTMAAFDGKIVLIAPARLGELNGETISKRTELWEWGGSAWTFVAAFSAPSGREGAGAARLGNKLVLFGGNNNQNSPGSYLDDMWEWDGIRWTEMHPSVRPPARAWSQMITRGDTIVLHGGTAPRPNSPQETVGLTDTWEWDGTDWIEKNVTGPTDCGAPQMAALGSKVIALCSSNTVMTTWQWDGISWTQLTPSASPPYRYGFALSARDDRIVLYGGYGDGKSFAETWEWDGTHWIDKTVADSPPARGGHRMQPFGTSVILYGGTPSNETWEYDGERWKIAASASRPSARAGAALGSMGDHVLLFGGIAYNADLQAFYLDETWRWEGSRWTRLYPSKSPAPRLWAEMAPLADRLLLFGGRNTEHSLSDTWEWDGSTWTERTPSAVPPARYSHAMAALDDKVVLHGGRSDSAELGDTWEWDGLSWSQRALDASPGSTPQARYFHGMDRLGSHIVLYGGYSSARPFFYLSHDDTWLWDGRTWSSLDHSPRPQFGSGTLPYDPVCMASLGSRLVLLSGLSLKTWEFDGMAWSQRAPNRDPDDTGTMARAGGTLVLLDKFMDTWIYRTDPPRIQSCDAATPCAAGTCVRGECTDASHSPDAGTNADAGQTPDAGPQPADAGLADGSTRDSGHGAAEHPPLPDPGTPSPLPGPSIGCAVLHVRASSAPLTVAFWTLTLSAVGLRRRRQSRV